MVAGNLTKFEQALRYTTAPSAAGPLEFLRSEYLRELWDEFAPKEWQHGGCCHVIAGEKGPWPLGLRTPAQLRSVLQHYALLERARPLVARAEAAYVDSLPSNVRNPRPRGRVVWTTVPGSRLIPKLWAIRWMDHARDFIPNTPEASKVEAAFRASHLNYAKHSPQGKRDRVCGCVYPYAPLLELHALGLNVGALVSAENVSHCPGVDSLVILNLPAGDER